MLLHYKIDDDIELEGQIYTVNASFDNVLRVIDIIRDSSVPSTVLPKMCLYLLFTKNSERTGNVKKNFNSFDLFHHLTLAEQSQLVKDVLEGYVEFEDGIQYDLNGDPMPVPDNEEEGQGAKYDFDQDDEFIYASFYQAYGMDLTEEQGKLHWFKFKALLNGLPSNTIFSQVVQIRGWTPAQDRKKRNQVMREQQRRLRLEGDED